MEILASIFPSNAESFSGYSLISFVFGGFGVGLVVFLFRRFRQWNTGENERTACVYHNYGFLLFKNGDYELAKSAYYKAIAIRELIGDRGIIDRADSHIRLGQLYKEQHSWDSAIREYLAALNLYKQQLSIFSPKCRYARRELKEIKSYFRRNS